MLIKSISYNKIAKLEYLFISILSLLLSGCLSIKPSSSKSGKNYFETFFVGSEGTQYFINPLKFINKSNNEVISLDITFRYRDEIKIKDSAVINFSIESMSIFKAMENIKLSGKDIQINSKEVKLLFNEKKKNNFISRFSTKLSLIDIKRLFSGNNWEVNISDGKQISVFSPTKNSIRAFSIVNDKVFILM